MSSLLFEALKTNDQAAVDTLLTEEPALAGARNERGLSAVLWAVYMGRKEILQMLLAKQPTLDIFEAAAVGDRAKVEEWVTRDLQLVNAYAADGFHPLGLAAFFGHHEIVSFLLDRGASVNQPSNNGPKVAPLHAAVARGYIEIVRVLLARGADVNQPQEQGITPLHGAAFEGNQELVSLLLAAGADATARTDDGKTPLDIAVSKGYTLEI